jgi:YVTN family beta-propeller protein
VRIDPHTNRVTGSITLPGADWVTEAAGSLWVSEETNVVARVDPSTLKVVARIPVGRNPLGSALVRGQLWVPCIDGGVVSVIDPRSGRVVRTFPAGPGPIVVLPAGGHTWVSHSTGNSVWRL